METLLQIQFEFLLLHQHCQALMLQNILALNKQHHLLQQFLLQLQHEWREVHHQLCLFSFISEAAPT
jgi:hypothetical protein